MNFDNVSPAIVIIAYVLCEVAKVTFMKSKKARKLLPVLATTLGIIAGVLLYFFYPQGIGSFNILEAIATGGLSGLAATGCNQLYNKIRKFKGEITTTDTVDMSNSDGEGY